MTRSPDHQEDTMTDDLIPDAEIVEAATAHGRKQEHWRAETAAEEGFEEGAKFALTRVAEAHKAHRDLAFEGALLIEWVRQVVGGFSMPTAVELGDLFDQCSDYSDKWNSGNAEPLPDSRLPSHGQFVDAFKRVQLPDGKTMSTDAANTLANVAMGIMPKPTDTEETSPQAWAELVRDERERQIAKGYNAKHDAEHGVKHLALWAIDYARRGRTVEAAALMLAATEIDTEETSR